MKILFVHNFYQQFGGEDSVALSERRLLETRGHEVLFWTRHNDEIKSYGVVDKAEFFPQTIYSRRTTRDITQAVARFQPDLAYIHNVYPLISPSVYHTLRALRVPMVQVLHDFRPYCANGWFYVDGQVCERCKFGNHFHGVLHRCYRGSYLLSTLYSATLAMNRRAGMLDKVDAFICLTGFFEQKIRELGIPEDKIFVRPNFIDALPDRAQSRNGSGGSYGLYLGRLSAEKGLWTLIRAFEQLPETELRITGTGPMEPEIRSYVRERKLSNISLVGFRRGDEKWQLLENCRFGFVPSECYENFPVVALECYAASKPVIASNMGGLPYIVEDGKSGFLFEPHNADDLAAKVRQLNSNPALARSMGERGRHLAETKYGPEEGYDRLMTIFEKVLSR